jgi:hypothetical protein
MPAVARGPGPARGAGGPRASHPLELELLDSMIGATVTATVSSSSLHARRRQGLFRRMLHGWNDSEEEILTRNFLSESDSESLVSHDSDSESESSKCGIFMYEGLRCCENWLVFANSRSGARAAGPVPLQQSKNHLMLYPAKI